MTEYIIDTLVALLYKCVFEITHLLRASILFENKNTWEQLCLRFLENLRRTNFNESKSKLSKKLRTTTNIRPRANQ